MNPISSVFIAVVFSILVLFIHNGHAQPPRPPRSPAPSFDPSACTPSLRQTHFGQVETALSTEIAAAPNLVAAFVRAAFHDCVTATSDKPDSGCNGSLRLEEELTNADNARLRGAIAAIRRSVRNTCVSVADGIQIANAVALEIAGGPNILSSVVDSANPRTDATTADTVTNELPSRTSPFPDLLAFYERKGFSLQEFIASLAVGHSLGGFATPNGIAPFTTDIFTVSSSYCFNLVQRISSGTNLQGFNTLQSDVTLISNPEAVNRLQTYAGCFDGGCSASSQTGLQIMRNDFTDFAIKLSQMTGSTLP